MNNLIPSQDHKFHSNINLHQHNSKQAKKSQEYEDIKAQQMQALDQEYEHYLKSVKHTARNALHRNNNSKRELKNRKKQREFYQNKIHQHKNLLDQFQQFQANMIHRTIKTRIKVFSNSKTQSQQPTPTPNKQKHVPIKVIHLKQLNNHHQSSDTKQQKPKKRNIPSYGKITRVQKPQSKQIESTPIKSQRRIGTIRLYQRSKQKNTKSKQNTKSKKRSYKIQVTSVPRRRKLSSSLGSKHKNSSEILSLKPSLGKGNCDSILVNSFNNTTFQ